MEKNKNKDNINKDEIGLENKTVRETLSHC